MLLGDKKMRRVLWVRSKLNRLTAPQFRRQLMKQIKTTAFSSYDTNIPFRFLKQKT